VINSVVSNSISDIISNIYSGEIGSRLIPTFAGSQYGTLDTPISFGANEDFEIDIEFASTDTVVTSGRGIFGYSISGTTNFFQINTPAGVTSFQTPDGALGWTHGDAHLDGKIHIITLYRAGLTLGLRLDGIDQVSSLKATAQQIDINLIGCLGVATVPSQFFEGQFLSIKFTNITIGAIRNFVLDSGSTTEQFARGSTTDKITLINFATTDWNRYTQQRNIAHDAGVIGEAWVGDNIIVNGTFDTDLSDWIIIEAGQTVEWVDGELHIITDGTGAGVQQNTLTTDDIFLVNLNYRAISNTLKVQIGSTGFTLNTTKKYSIVHKAEAVSLVLYRNAGAGEGYFDNVSAQKILEVA